MDVVVAYSEDRCEAHVGYDRQHAVESAEEHNGNVGFGAGRPIHHAAGCSVEHGHWRATLRREVTGKVKSDVEDWRAF